MPLLLVFPAAPVRADDPPSYSSQARELMGHGDYQKALEELEKGQSLYPYNQVLRRNLARAYTATAERELKLGRYDQAAEHFGQARGLFPEQGELALMRGIALYLGKHYDSARAELEQAGEEAAPLLYLGKISYDTGDLRGALERWRRGLELEPGQKDLLRLVRKAELELPVESKMDRGYSSMFDLSFDAELPRGMADEALDALEKAYNSVGADLGLFPATRIPVLLYASRDYRSVTAGPQWSAGLYDGKIRLPVGGATRLTPQMRAILAHEFTHVVVAELSGGNVPTWLNEGLAEIEGRREFAPPGPDPLRASAVRSPLSLATLAAPFASMSGPEAALAYQQSFSLTDFLVSRYGWYPVQRILKRLGERATVEAAVAEALSDWGLDLPALLQEWRESLANGVDQQ